MELTQTLVKPTSLFTTKVKIMCFFKNLPNWRTRRAYRDLQKALQKDPDFAYSWHCNIAMPIYDRTQLSHEDANKIASALMKHLFDVNTSNN